MKYFESVETGDAKESVHSDREEKRILMYIGTSNHSETCDEFIVHIAAGMGKGVGNVEIILEKRLSSERLPSIYVVIRSRHNNTVITGEMKCRWCRRQSKPIGRLRLKMMPFRV